MGLELAQTSSVAERNEMKEMNQKCNHTDATHHVSLAFMAHECCWPFHL